MGFLNNPVLGNIEGITGDIYTRRRGRRIQVVSRAPKIHICMTPEAVDRRNRFRTASQFAKRVCSLESLDKIWNESKGNKVSGFHAALSANYEYALTSGPGEKNIITPGGFAAEFDITEISVNKIIVVIPPLAQLIPAGAPHNSLSFNAVVSFFSASGINPDLFFMLGFTRMFDSYDPNQSLLAEIDLTNEEKSEAQKFSSARLFAAVVLHDEIGKPAAWSSTYVKSVS